MEDLLADIEKGNQRAYDGLVVTIEAIQNKMGIIFAICDSPALQLETVYRYEKELSPAIRSYRVEISQTEPNVRKAVGDVVASEEYLRAGGAAVVTVLGLEKISSFRSSISSNADDSRSNLEKFFGYLQWTRESFREFKFPVVIWTSNDLVKKIIRQSPDFWSWRQDVFEFKAGLKNNQILNLNLPVQTADVKNNLASETIPLPDLLNLVASLEQDNPNSPLLSSMYLRTGQAFYQLASNDHTVDHSTDIQAAKDYLLLGIAGLKSSDFAELASAFSDLAEVYIFQNEFTLAQEFYRQALENYQKAEDRQGEADTLQAIGDAQRRIHQNTKALENYQQAIEIYRQVGDRLGEANTLKELGALCAAENNYEQALTYYQQGAEISHQIQDFYTEAIICYYASRSLIELEQIPAAIEAYKRSIELFTQINMPELVAKIQSELESIS